MSRRSTFQSSPSASFFLSKWRNLLSTLYSSSPLPVNYLHIDANPLGTCVRSTSRRICCQGTPGKSRRGTPESSRYPPSQNPADFSGNYLKAQENTEHPEVFTSFFYRLILGATGTVPPPRTAPVQISILLLPPENVSATNSSSTPHPTLLKTKTTCTTTGPTKSLPQRNFIHRLHRIDSGPRSSPTDTRGRFSTTHSTTPTSTISTTTATTATTTTISSTSLIPILTRAKLAHRINQLQRVRRPLR